MIPSEWFLFAIQCNLSRSEKIKELGFTTVLNTQQMNRYTRIPE